MRSAYFCFTVDDVAMAGYSTETHFARLLDFCAEEEIKGTFFVVPRADGVELGEKRGYLDLFARAASAGHEIAQHGLDHDRFECGIPPSMVLELPHEGPARKRLATHRREIEAGHTVERLRNMLRTGRQLLMKATHLPILGFRAPCASTCANLYLALEAEGYTYDSSKIFQETAWDILNDKGNSEPRPITRAIYDSHQTGGRLVVLPLAAEYAWYLTKAKYRTLLNLAKQDCDACFAEQIPFVSLCHVSPLQEGEGLWGFDLFRELFAHARQRADETGASFASVTLAEMSKRLAAQPSPSS